MRFLSLFLSVVLCFAMFIVSTQLVHSSECICEGPNGGGSPQTCTWDSISEEYICDQYTDESCTNACCNYFEIGCSGGGGGTGAFACPSGSVKSCGVFDELGAMYNTNFKGTCNALAASAWAQPGAPSNCQVNCLCCPAGQTRSCAATSTYEYATTQGKSTICQRKGELADLSTDDLYVSNRANPAFNPALGGWPDNPLCGEYEGCLTRLTTCRLNSCTCVAPNSPPTGTLSCPSQIVLGQSGAFTLNGSDVNGNLQKAQLYRSPSSPSNPEGDWTQIGGDITCLGGSCAPQTNWAPGATGSYVITADYYDSASTQCSGNPFIPYSSYPKYGYSACSNPLSNDSCTVNVVAPTPTPIPPPTLTCTAYTNPVSIVWDWNVNGTLTYLLQVWNSTATIVYDWYAGPTVTTSATPGVTQWGHVLSGDGTQSSPWSNTASCTVPALSVPSISCGSFNQVGVYVPLTITWANGTKLQVTRDYTPADIADPQYNQYWLYNTFATPPTITIDPPPPGKYMPPGHTYYARTTYDGSTFSAAASKYCEPPSNPLPVTISGPLQQKSGTGCSQANATNNFNVQNPTITTNPSSCVATACTALDNNGSPSNTVAAKYTCTTTFSNINCLDDNPPTWPTSATLTLTPLTPSGYTFIGWTPNGSCTPATNSKVVNAGDTIANQPITFDFSGSNWIKLKDSSYNGVSITGITVPAFVTSYDADDDATKYFIIGNAGAVLKATVNPSSAYSSPPKNWYDSSYPAGSPSMNPSAFLNYVKSRKEYQTVSDMSAIDQDGIYVWSGAGALTLNNANLNQATASKFVLIVDDNVTIDQDKFNIGNNCIDTSTSKNIAILSKTGTITFSTSTQCAAGVFIAQTVDTGSITSQGLKIKGNLIAQTTLTNGRAWSDTSRPGLFAVFDPVQYINLLPYLSTASYDWRQIQ